MTTVFEVQDAEMYTISFFIEEGEVSFLGETLEALHEQLRDSETAPDSSFEVCNEPGFTIGWVSKKSWRYA